MVTMSTLPVFTYAMLGSYTLIKNVGRNCIAAN